MSSPISWKSNVDITIIALFAFLQSSSSFIIIQQHQQQQHHQHQQQQKCTPSSKKRFGGISNNIPTTPSTTRSHHYYYNNYQPHKKQVVLLNSALTNEDSSFKPGINAINEYNSELKEMLDRLRKREYFRLYSCDLLGSCEYMPQELFECYSESCEIYPVDDEEVPSSIKSVDSLEYDFELDGWARWDMPSDDYYDTLEFPEEYTGYDGSEVWNFIHQRICFQDENNDYYWKADFNKAVSGLHSMISCQVVRGLQEKGDGEEEEEVRWTLDPRIEFDRRLGPNGETPLAIENLYFGYMLLVSAIGVAKDRLLMDCQSGKIDEKAALDLQPILEHALFDDANIDVASKKLHDHATTEVGSSSSSSSYPLWEARMRTRELMRIMNCVQCNKCRFHGKIAVLGLSTAFQVLLGRSGEGGDPKRVHRVELAALMTTLSKFAMAVDYVQQMLS